MSTKRVCDLSCGAMHELALVLDKAGFDAALIQKVINSRGNKHAQVMRAALVVSSDDRFELVKTFEVVVPEGYDHAICLAAFNKEHRKEFYTYNDSIIDKNFSKATTKLIAGRKFKVKVFQIKETVTSEDCMAHLRSQKAVLVGAQGASLAYEQGKDQLLKGRWHVSFDEKEALWKDADGYHGVPDVYRDSDGGFRFYLGHFEGGWDVDDCLLCFCDE